jgi:hypothetical protein
MSSGSFSVLNNIIFPQDVQCIMVKESVAFWSPFLITKSFSSLAFWFRDGTDTLFPQA